VDLRLLGPLELRFGDGPVELGPRKQRAVLAMLALRAGRTVSVDSLIGGLWGESPPASAAKMVQLYVSHLRPLLDGSGARIVTLGHGYQLELADGEVDTLRFERLLAIRAPARLSRCGTAMRWRTSPRSRSPPRRSAASTSCACAPPNPRSTPTSRPGGTPT
jgi:DNA-binding SARP family transcriptional activator